MDRSPLLFRRTSARRQIERVNMAILCAVALLGVIFLSQYIHSPLTRLLDEILEKIFGGQDGSGDNGRCASHGKEASFENWKYCCTEVQSSHSLVDVTIPVPYPDSALVGEVFVAEVPAEQGSHYSRFEPPADTVFTHLVLGLDGIVDSLQQPALVHVLVNNIEVWRLWTPPSNATGKSQLTFGANKDVSLYGALWQTAQDFEVIVDFQGKAGNPASSLKFSAILYNDPEKVHSYDTVESLYTDSQVQPAHHAQAVSDLQQGTIRTSLDPVSSSTVKAVLVVGALATEADAEWYNGHVQDPSDRWHGWESKDQSAEVLSSELSSIDGHHDAGPFRILKIHVDSYVAGIVPVNPVLTPAHAVWSKALPVVANLHQTDIPFYEVDLTPFLPVLWNGDHEVTIEVWSGGNSLGQVEGSSWILSASLLTWDFDGIKTTRRSSGPASESLFKKPDVVVSRGRSSLDQVVDVKHTLTTSATLLIDKDDGSTETVHYQHLTKLSSSSVLDISAADIDSVFSVSQRDEIVVNDHALDPAKHVYDLVLDRDGKSQDLVVDDKFHSAGLKYDFSLVLALGSSSVAMGLDVHEGGQEYRRHLRVKDGHLQFDHTY